MAALLFGQGHVFRDSVSRSIRRPLVVLLVLLSCNVASATSYWAPPFANQRKDLLLSVKLAPPLVIQEVGESSTTGSTVAASN